MKKYLLAREKTLRSPTTSLNGDELKSLLHYHCRKDDTPIKSRVSDMRLQWEQRRYRILLDQSPPALPQAPIINQEVNEELHVSTDTQQDIIACIGANECNTFDHNIQCSLFTNDENYPNFDVAENSSYNDNDDE
jgi:hypothetical protein